MNRYLASVVAAERSTAQHRAVIPTLSPRPLTRFEIPDAEGAAFGADRMANEPSGTNGAVAPPIHRHTDDLHSAAAPPIPPARTPGNVDHRASAFGQSDHPFVQRRVRSSERAAASGDGLEDATPNVLAPAPPSIATPIPVDGSDRQAPSPGEYGSSVRPFGESSAVDASIVPGASPTRRRGTLAEPFPTSPTAPLAPMPAHAAHMPPPHLTPSATRGRSSVGVSDSVPTDVRAQPTIHVSIGRIEVRAAMAAPKRVDQRTPRGVMSLDDYLAAKDRKIR